MVEFVSQEQGERSSKGIYNVIFKSVRVCGSRKIDLVNEDILSDSEIREPYGNENGARRQAEPRT